MPETQAQSQQCLKKEDSKLKVSVLSSGPDFQEKLSTKDLLYKHRI